MTLSARWRAAIVLVATVVGCASTARLAIWQLDRAALKVQIQTEIDTRRTLPPLTAASLAATVDAARAQDYRKASLRGHWVAERTVFLENRQMNGRPGFFVVTPLQLEGRKEAVLVQRGWVPRNFEDRAALPAVKTPSGLTLVEGLIAPPPSRLYEFAPMGSGPIRQNLDVAAFGRESHLELLPLSVLQGDSPSTVGDGLLRQWALPVLDVQMHYGYAFQWFALCALMAGLYVWFQLVRPYWLKA